MYVPMYVCMYVPVYVRMYVPMYVRHKNYITGIKPRDPEGPLFAHMHIDILT